MCGATISGMGRLQADVWKLGHVWHTIVKREMVWQYMRAVVPKWEVEPAKVHKQLFAHLLNFQWSLTGFIHKGLKIREKCVSNKV